MAEDKQPTTEVEQGGSQAVRYEADPDQLVKLRHVFPTDGAEHNSEEASRTSQTHGPAAMPTPEAEAEAGQPSAWEAIEPGVDPSDRGQ